MNTKYLFLSLIAFATFFEAGADIFFKQWASNNKTSLIIIGVVLYTIGTILWAFSLKYEYLSKAIVVFTAINMIIIVLIGVLFFKEELTLLQKIGIFLGIVSVVLIES